MRFASHGRFMAKIREILLGRGTQGIGQNDLNQLVRTKIFTRDDMNTILEEWEGRGWVQKFVSTGMSKHPKIIWRATTLLRDEWSSLHIDGELPTGPAPEDLPVSRKASDFQDV